MSERCGTCGAFRLEAGAHGLSNLPTCPECGAHQTTETTRAPFGGAPAPDNANARAILERSRTVYWDAPKGAVREIIRLLGDELERRLWAGGAPAVPSEAALDSAREAFNRAIANWHWNEALRQALAAAYAVDFSSLAPAPSGPTDEQLLDAFVAGCNRENELNDAELSPQHIRAGIAAAMRGALNSVARLAVPGDTQKP